MIRAVLVDDEPPARVRMRQLLDAAGDVSVVGEAGNADEAREVIRDTRPDLLFLDVEMPRGARHGAGRVAARAAAVHRLCDGVRQLRARRDRRRRHRLPAEAGVARQARGHARSRARAARDADRRARHRRGIGGAVAHVAGIAAADRGLRLRRRIAAGARRRRRFLRRVSDRGAAGGSSDGVHGPCCSAMRPARAWRPAWSRQRCRRASTPRPGSRISSRRS